MRVTGWFPGNIERVKTEPWICFVEATVFIVDRQGVQVLALAFSTSPRGTT